MRERAGFVRRLFRYGSPLLLATFLLPGVAEAATKGSDPAPIGKWIAPLIFLGAFALLANGFMHLDPERKKANEKTVGVITAAAGIFWWPFLIGMMGAQGLGPLTNFVTGLAGMYAFFFTVLGIIQIFGLP